MLNILIKTKLLNFLGLSTTLCILWVNNHFETFRKNCVGYNIIYSQRMELHLHSG